MSVREGNDGVWTQVIGFIALSLLPSLLSLVTSTPRIPSRTLCHLISTCSSHPLNYSCGEPGSSPSLPDLMGSSVHVLLDPLAASDTQNHAGGNYFGICGSILSSFSFSVFLSYCSLLINTGVSRILSWVNHTASGPVHSAAAAVPGTAGI